MASEKLAPPSTDLLRPCLFFILAVLLLMHWFALPKITSIERAGDKPEEREALLLPANINIRNQGGGEQSYYINLHYKKGQQTLYHLHAQNCLRRITLNGFPFTFPLKDACNFAKGMVIDFKHKLTPGTNKLRLDTDAPGIAIGPVIFSGKTTLSDILGSLLTAGSCIAIILFVRRRTGDYLSGIILSAGFLLYLYVMTHTTFMWKKYDLPQHLEYITFIANQWRWPSTFQGFLTYHPPLYYTLQAILLGITNWLGSFSAIETLRTFSLACFLGSSIFSILILRRIITHNMAYYFAVALLVFYPGGIITSARLDSNLLFYTFFSGSLYFLLCWVQTARMKALAWALSMCGLAIATRSNALLLLPMFGLATLYVWYRHSWATLWSHTRSSIVWLGILGLLLGAMVNFGRPAYDTLTTKQDREFIVGNADYLAAIASGLRINNKWHHYLTFNSREYFDPPYFNVWSNRGGRLFFWDSVLKSSMYGEFSYPNQHIAYYLNWVLLCLVLYVPFSALCEARRLRHQPEWLWLLIPLLISVAGLAANRILHPIACSQDFRYVYPAITALCALVGFSIQQHLLNRRAPLALVGTAFIISFVTLSLLFFLNMR